MRTAPYGAWASPITAARVAEASVGLGPIVADGSDLWWIETRPAEGGRAVLVRRRGDAGPEDVLAAPWSVRTRAHEYGGGALAVGAGVVCFSQADDQRLYRLGDDGVPAPLTPAGAYRWADGAIDAARRALVVVREDASREGEPRSALVRVDLDGAEVPRVLVEGADFYAAPRIAPGGRRLAWLSWNHPDMPWDASELWVGRLDDAGRVQEPRRVAGGRGESIAQPEWAHDRSLLFVSDRSGFWNLFRRRDGDAEAEALCPMDAEFAGPQWVFGLTTYAVVSARTVVAAFLRDGRWQLGLVDLGRRRLEPVAAPWSDVAFVRPSPSGAVLRGASFTAAPALVELALPERSWRTIRPAAALPVDEPWLSVPRAIAFRSAGGRTAHALFYPPVNPEHTAPAHEKPPLLVRVHGGPTSAAASALDLAVQFWTSRGFALLDVNYGGSSGYGRAYRQLLDGQWGVVDVEDCIHAARFVAAEGWVDPARMAIRGSSAGGFTVLCALAFHDVFAAGASWYGVGDLEALARETHKFEAHYADRLVGPWPARADLYQARSPLHAADRIRAPVIFFQGLDDRVVPPGQAEAMVQALRARNRVVEYVTFPGEAHGFRRAESIRLALDAELAFYARVLSFAA